MCTFTIHGTSTRPHWCTLPPEIIETILQFLATDNTSLQAYSQAAGGFHHTTLSDTQPNPDALREAIRKTSKLTDKPFGVNITLLPSIHPPDYEGYARAAVEEGVNVFETAGNNRQFSSL